MDELDEDIEQTLRNQMKRLLKYVLFIEKSGKT